MEYQVIKKVNGSYTLLPPMDVSPVLPTVIHLEADMMPSRLTVVQGFVDGKLETIEVDVREEE